MFEPSDLGVSVLAFLFAAFLTLLYLLPGYGG
jgi:hypothetical protein